MLQAQARHYEPYEEKATPTELMQQKPKAGSIVSEKPSVNGTTEFTLINGVKVYYRRTNYQADNVIVRFWGDGGGSSIPPRTPNMSFFSSYHHQGRLMGNFDETTLDRSCWPRRACVSPSVSQERQSINGSSSVKDAETLFQLTYLYFRAARRDQKAFDNEPRPHEVVSRNHNAQS